jgi:hypothetical protein
MSLSYTITPFHPSITYSGQIKTELGYANNNFTTLAQAFVNNDPTSLTFVYSANSASVAGYTVSATPAPNTLLPLNSNAQFPSSVFPPINNNSYSNAVNLTSATSDYFLSVGQVAYISFTNTSSVPLHIATTNGTYYEMVVNSSNSNGNNLQIWLNPNNTTYSNAFNYFDYWIYNGGVGHDIVSCSGFYVGESFMAGVVFISNFTTFKTTRVLQIESASSYPSVLRVGGSIWNDTTTSWTSLGTITFPQATSGYVLVRRLV